MPATLKSKSPKISYYNVKGDTLETIWKRIAKSGPIDPNDKKRVAFLTTTTLKCDPDRASVEGDGNISQEGSTGWYEAKAKLKKMEVTLESSIKCPRVNFGKLSKPAQKEWKRFFHKALDHENEHIRKALNESMIILKEMNALRGDGFAETEQEAAQSAAEDLKTVIYNEYLGSMDGRLGKVHKDFDSATKHGERTGAKLDTKIK